MKPIATIFVIVLGLFCSWRFWLYHDQTTREEQSRAAVSELRPEQLAGMPSRLEESYKAAVQRGPKEVGAWLRMCGSQLSDPRKAWIELDYCLLVTRDNPAEARRIFASVKKRLTEASPVWPRVKKLERAYE